jgi:UDP-glucuronate decarboxylase
LKVTGGAGFVGSHLTDKLMNQGHKVTVIDDFSTGNSKNVATWFNHSNFMLLHHDVVNPFVGEVDEIYHLASPASPPRYMQDPVKTLKTNIVGTINMLELARKTGAKVLLASTSEIYGDPHVHPQPESYWGHVNPIGPRACYDEGKRVAETLCYAFARRDGVKVRVARIFNTFGPRMDVNDGRVVSNFIVQALQNKPITIYGNGTQTRSFQYVSDLVDGLVMLMASNFTQPVNFGNPEEFTINKFAKVIQKFVGTGSKIVHLDAAEDDPQRRKPDITRAKRMLNWQPHVNLKKGLKKTIEYFKAQLQHADNISKGKLL